jgi:hypothetical protein
MHLALMASLASRNLIQLGHFVALDMSGDRFFRLKRSSQIRAPKHSKLAKLPVWRSSIRQGRCPRWKHCKRARVANALVVPAGLAFSNVMVGAVVVAVLYFAREILVPIALAVLLSFALALSCGFCSA